MKKNSVKKLAVIFTAILAVFALFAGCSKDDTIVIGISQIVDHPSLNVCRQGAVDKLAEARVRRR